MKPTEDELRQALKSLYSDNAELHAAVQMLASEPLPEPADTLVERDIEQDVDVDLQRAERCGFPEVIFGEGKSPALVIRILVKQHAVGQDGFVTRVNPEQATAVLAGFPQAVYNNIARTLRVPATSTPVSTAECAGPVVVITAGSSDRPVAEEALETLRWMRISCELLQDCGVAGPQRLLRHIPKLQQAVAVICVAGMEAALPSVVGGYVSCPVIGVPTSVGYGASMNGMTAMLSMLTCCASNVVAVNIDAGFKGGYVAGLIASRSGRRINKEAASE